MIDLKQLDQISRQNNSERAAQIREADIKNPFEIQKYVFDLTTAKDEFSPFNIGFPFKSISFEDGSDNGTYVEVKFNSNDSGGTKKKFQTNSGLSTDRMFSECFISWPAQSGKSITCYVYLTSKYVSGSLINSGTVTTSNPSVLAGPTRVVLSAVTATIIVPADTTNRNAIVQNKTGADLYVGGSTIGAVGGVSEGLLVPVNGLYYHQNTAALYGWSVAGGNISYVRES